MFDVSPQMQEYITGQGDVPIRDSQFFHPKGQPDTTTELAYGLTHDYRASNASGEWQAVAIPLDSIWLTPDLPPEPPSTSLVEAIDVSNYQPTDLTPLLDGVEHVIVRLFHSGEGPSGTHSIRQIQSVQANGRTLGGYMWPYRGLDPKRQIESSLSILADTQSRIPILWIDVEPYNDTLPTLYELEGCINACAALHQPCGIYTGKWVWDRLGNPTQFSYLPLMHAEYDILPSLILLTPYGGWNVCAGHQYTSTPIDRSIFDRTYTEV